MDVSVSFLRCFCVQPAFCGIDLGTKLFFDGAAVFFSVFWGHRPFPKNRFMSSLPAGVAIRLSGARAPLGYSQTRGRRLAPFCPFASRTNPLIPTRQS